VAATNLQVGGLNLTDARVKAGATRMNTTKLCLRAVMVVRDGKSCWSGEYRCSVCDLRFRPDPGDAARLTREFEEHVSREHPDPLR